MICHLYESLVMINLCAKFEVSIFTIYDCIKDNANHTTNSMAYLYFKSYMCLSSTVVELFVESRRF